MESLRVLSITKSGSQSPREFSRCVACVLATNYAKAVESLLRTDPPLSPRPETTPVGAVGLVDARWFIRKTAVPHRVLKRWVQEDQIPKDNPGHQPLVFEIVWAPFCNSVAKIFRTLHRLVPRLDCDLTFGSPCAGSIVTRPARHYPQPMVEGPTHLRRVLRLQNRRTEEKQDETLVSIPLSEPSSPEGPRWGGNAEGNLSEDSETLGESVTCTPSTLLCSTPALSAASEVETLSPRSCLGADVQENDERDPQLGGTHWDEDATFLNVGCDVSSTASRETSLTRDSTPGFSEVSSNSSATTNFDSIQETHGHLVAKRTGRIIWTYSVEESNWYYRDDTTGGIVWFPQ